MRFANQDLQYNSMAVMRFTNEDLQRAQKLYTYALICYIVGLFIWITQLPSIIQSFTMVSHGYIKRRKGEVIAFGIIELLFWIALPATVWMNMYRHWIGWPALLAWFIISLAFGIPRIIFSQDCDGIMESLQLKQQHPTQQPAVHVNLMPHNKPEVINCSPPPPTYTQPMPAVSGSAIKHLPSMESLAAELNIPKLFDLASAGIKTEDLLQMDFGESKKKYEISNEDYMKLKIYKKQHSRLMEV